MTWEYSRYQARHRRPDTFTRITSALAGALLAVLTGRH